MDYLAEYQHGLLVLNIKEAGIPGTGVCGSYCGRAASPVLPARAFLASTAPRWERTPSPCVTPRDECIETVLKYKGPRGLGVD